MYYILLLTATIVAITRVNVTLYVHLRVLFNSAIAYPCQNLPVMLFLFVFVEYIPDDGRKRSKHVGGLLFDCMYVCRTVVQLL